MTPFPVFDIYHDLYFYPVSITLPENKLIVVDLAAADPQLLERYLGAAGAAAFLEFHRPRAVA